jgi:hypothetical protein
LLIELPARLLTDGKIAAHFNPAARAKETTMPIDLGYLEGKKICIVFVKSGDEDQPDGEVKMRCMYGRANISTGRFKVEGPNGSFEVPTKSHANVMPSDGTEILKDSEYFVMVRVSGMDL